MPILMCYLQLLFCLLPLRWLYIQRIALQQLTRLNVRLTVRKNRQMQSMTKKKRLKNV